jgi:hypothetical protein
VKTWRTNIASFSTISGEFMADTVWLMETSLRIRMRKDSYHFPGSRSGIRFWVSRIRIHELL